MTRNMFLCFVWMVIVETVLMLSGLVIRILCLGLDLILILVLRILDFFHCGYFSCQDSELFAFLFFQSQFVLFIKVHFRHIPSWFKDFSIELTWAIKIWYFKQAVYFRSLQILFFIIIWRNVMKKLWGWWTILWIKFQTPTNDIPTSFTYLFSKRNPVLFYPLENATHLFPIIESLPHYTFIQYYANRPYLCLLIVNAFLKRFRCHIRWRTNIVLQRGFRMSMNLTVTEINNFRGLIVKHDISWLEISV